MNNEPVAWIDPNDRLSEPFSWNKTSCHTIPLYTRPANLTEWEIKECWEEATEMQEHFCSQYFDFAQLILRKAQEK
jgi:hypothetical protein